MTQTPDPRIQLAADALTDLYQDWEDHGGPSPSTQDEAIVIAQVLDVVPVTDEAFIEAMWQEVDQDNAELAVVAAAHVAAIDARDKALRQWLAERGQ